MMDWSALLRPELADQAAYAPPDASGFPVRLDANEAPANPSAAVSEAVMRALSRTPLERYPDPRMAELKERIAARTGARPSELLIGAGSDEVIALVVLALSRPAVEGAPAMTLVPTPTFVMYRTTTRTHGLKVVEVPLDSQWDLDVRAMGRAIEMLRPNVVFIASPNNPTSNGMSDDRIAAILERAPQSLVVVDEAYADYAGISLRSWRGRFPNLAILRTLSKIGLAALRIGWLEADENLIREIDKVRQPYNVSATSQAAASAVLAEAWPDVMHHVQATIRERERVIGTLHTMAGVEVVSSQANFLWIGTPRPAAVVCEQIASSGILVKSFHSSGGRLANRIRATIGAGSDNDRFIEAFAAALSA
jgi:histidinol-phosphate aminotransferase